MLTNPATAPDTRSLHPFLTLPYEPALESLGGEYYDIVTPAEFPQHILRFRNDEILPQMGLNPGQVSDADFIEAFGKFHAARPCLALRYHGYQFGIYNPGLGDGRGFLLGQIRGTDGELYDFGTKGSGRTPHSRTADGRLTLKGGVREVLAAEALHRAGVTTSRCFSLVETGEGLWRGDEPSPTRSSVMVRWSRSHIRFGNFERFLHDNRPDLIQILLDHVIQVYYPHLWGQPDAYGLFYAELVQRVAELVAQWMSEGFCHAVLNTDNMSITGESFDYGPFAFIPTFDPNFTSAYFDHYGRYSYSNQPGICQWNLEMLQRPLAKVMSESDLAAGLAPFPDQYYNAYTQRMIHKLGFENLPDDQAEPLVRETLQFLLKTQVGYHAFFAALRQHFTSQWRNEIAEIFPSLPFSDLEDHQAALNPWRSLYFQTLLSCPESEMTAIADRLQRHNPLTTLLRPAIEAIWEPISIEDNWQPFYDLLTQIRAN